MIQEHGGICPSSSQFLKAPGCTSAPTRASRVGFKPYCTCTTLIIKHITNLYIDVVDRGRISGQPQHHGLAATSSAMTTISINDISTSTCEKQLCWTMIDAPFFAAFCHPGHSLDFFSC
mmetsp:Transcript_57854/g.152187  ORF Transcript_57854/g.152187 Transcript_57854/m.152187 type:complete len:119 (+) Transcript_57854:278-634(+)